MTSAVTSYLFDPPPVKTLPISLDQDIIVTFQNIVQGSNPVTLQDWPTGYTVELRIGKLNATVASAMAEITGPNAVCRIKSAVANTISPGLPWRCIVSIPDPDGVDTDAVVPINGPTERDDGVDTTWS
jgi:hypothetical protein